MNLLRVLPIIVIFGVFGCSSKDKLHPLQGRVTYLGNPVSKGSMIIFGNPTSGIYMTSKFDENGDYRIEMAEGLGMPAGTYEVFIIPPQYNLSPEYIEKYRQTTTSPHLARFPDIPLRYRDPKTSGLKITLPEDGHIFNVDMTPAP